MEWLNSKSTVLAVISLVLVGVLGYGMVSTKNSMEARMSSMENELRTTSENADNKVTSLGSDLKVVTDKMGITAQELEVAQKTAKQMKQENAQLQKRMRKELSAKADSETVLKLHDEATNKLNAVEQDATNKINGVSGEVNGVRSDLNVTRADLNSTREDLANSKRDLGGLIARNSTELAELRKRGERDYVEFDIKTSKQFNRVGDVLIQLRKTDPKRQKYEVVINADDRAIVKRERTANEPVTFLVGRDRTRYEFVVNYVEKDRVRGYLSAPKDKLAAVDTDSPTLRVK